MPHLYPDAVIRVLRSAWKAPRAVPLPPRRVWRDGALIAIVAVAAVAEAVFRPRRPTRCRRCSRWSWLCRRYCGAGSTRWRCFAIVLVPVDIDPAHVLLYAGTFVLVMVYALFRWGSGRDVMIGSVLIVGALVLGLVRGGGADEIVGDTATGAGDRPARGAGSFARGRATAVARRRVCASASDWLAICMTPSPTMCRRSRSKHRRAWRWRIATAACEQPLGVIEVEAGRTLHERDRSCGWRVWTTGRSSPRARGLSDITRLTWDILRGGAAVPVAIDGDSGSLALPVAAAMSRIAQESVTNALRHAHGVTHVDVRAEVDERGVRLRVTNDGGVSSASRPGFGIIGMMERAALLGGSCSAGPSPEGGWQVVAELPRGDAGCRDDPCSRRGRSRAGAHGAEHDPRRAARHRRRRTGGRWGEAVALARRLRPDVCVFDIRMPGIDGIEATRLLAGPGRQVPLAVVVITTFDLDEYVFSALRAGAKGFLLKDAGSHLLTQAVRARREWRRPDRPECDGAPSSGVRRREPCGASGAAARSAHRS